MKSIALVLPTSSQYGVQNVFTEGMHQAFLRAGVDSYLLNLDDARDFCQKMLYDRPEYTFSFNGLVPNELGHLLYDVTQVPHISYLIDSAHRFLPLTRSSLSHITCVDQASVDFLKEGGFDRVLYAPHATDPSLLTSITPSRTFDVVILASCIDYEAIHDSWKARFSPSVYRVLREASDLVLNAAPIACPQAFAIAMNRAMQQGDVFDLTHDDVAVLVDEVELSVRGQERVAMARAITDATIDVFGGGEWKKYLGKQSNVNIHSAVSFDEALKIMKQSKIVLHSCAWIKQGLHERMLSAFMCGAAVAVRKNAYLEGEFGEQAMLFYEPESPREFNDVINASIANFSYRKIRVEAGQKRILAAHTWDHRAMLLKEWR